MVRSRSTPQNCPEFLPREPAFRADPYPFYERLRDCGPVVYSEQCQEWFVSGYSAVRQAFLEPNLAMGAGNLRLNHPVAPAAEASPPRALQERLKRISSLSGQVLNCQSTSKHLRLRKALAPGLTHSELAQQIEAVAQALAAKLPPRFDVVDDFASPLAREVLFRLLGVPFEPALLKLVETYLLSIDPMQSAPRILGGQLALGQIYDFVENGSNSLCPWAGLSDLQKNSVFSPEEFLANAAFLVFAGFPSTSRGLSLAVRTLLLHEQWQSLTAKGIGLAVEELILFDGPIQARPQFALADLELAGVQIKAGERVRLFVASANRDPLQFEQPDQLLLDRQPNAHLGFAVGSHSCLGAGLARLELEIGLTTLFKAFPKLRIADQNHPWSETYFLRGPLHLPVRAD